MKDLLESLQIDPAQRIQSREKKVRAKLPKWKLLAIGAVVSSFGAALALYSAATRPIPVEVFTIAPSRETGAFSPTLTAGGYVKDATVVYVVPRISGRIASLNVKEGDEVRADAVIARLDTRDIRQEVEEARATLLQAQANLSKLRYGPRAEEIAEMKAKVAAARLAKEKAYSDFARAKALLEARVLSQQVFDQVNTDYLVNERNVEAVQQALALLEAGTRKEEVQMAEAIVAAAQARLETAKNRLSYTDVRTPIAGRVLRKYRESGDYVSPEIPFLQGYDTIAVGSPVAAIAALENQEVSVDINETDISKVSLRQPVEIVPNAFPNEVFRGSVTRISPRADKNKNTLEVKVSFDEAAKKLPYDMSVKLTFFSPSGAAPTARPGLEIPASALLERNGKTFVFVVADSRARIRPVEVKADRGERLSLISGVAEGGRVIVSNISRLKDGTRVVVRQGR